MLSASPFGPSRTNDGPPLSTPFEAPEPIFAIPLRSPQKKQPRFLIPPLALFVAPVQGATLTDGLAACHSCLDLGHQGLCTKVFKGSPWRAHVSSHLPGPLGDPNHELYLPCEAGDFLGVNRLTSACSGAPTCSHAAWRSCAFLCVVVLSMSIYLYIYMYTYIIIYIYMYTPSYISICLSVCPSIPASIHRGRGGCDVGSRTFPQGWWLQTSGI